MQIADDKNEWNCRFGNERRNRRREKAKTYRQTDKLRDFKNSIWKKIEEMRKS